MSNQQSLRAMPTPRADTGVALYARPSVRASMQRLGRIPLAALRADPFWRLRVVDAAATNGDPALARLIDRHARRYVELQSRIACEAGRWRYGPHLSAALSDVLQEGDLDAAAALLATHARRLADGFAMRESHAAVCLDRALLAHLRNDMPAHAGFIREALALLQHAPDLAWRHAAYGFTRQCLEWRLLARPSYRGQLADAELLAVDASIEPRIAVSAPERFLPRFRAMAVEIDVLLVRVQGDDSSFRSFDNWRTLLLRIADRLLALARDTGDVHAAQAAVAGLELFDAGFDQTDDPLEVDLNDYDLEVAWALLSGTRRQQRPPTASGVAKLR